jgi:hypothetical protein
MPPLVASCAGSRAVRLTRRGTRRAYAPAAAVWRPVPCKCSKSRWKQARHGRPYRVEAMALPAPVCRLSNADAAMQGAPRRSAGRTQ